MCDKFLFRGKCINNDKWVEGNVIEQDNPEYHAYICMCFNAEINDKHTDIIEYNIKEIQPKTLGRFASRTDKNGTKIFENDIICIKYRFTWTNQLVKMIGVVKWKDCAYVVVWNDRTQNDDFLKYLNDIEVIGNIYDNLELLEKPYIE